jgi:hypothetical protein
MNTENHVNETAKLQNTSTQMSCKKVALGKGIVFVKSNMEKLLEILYGPFKFPRIVKYFVIY